MALEDIDRTDAKGPPRNRERYIGVFIGVLAVLLAICAMGGDNAAKEATLKNIEVTNTWAFFQAKNLRRQIVRAQIENVELTIIASPDMDTASKEALEKTIATYKAYETRLTSDPKSAQGLDELYEKGKALEEIRDRALKQDPYFDYGQALLQIAIVVASVAIISGGNVLVAVAGLLGIAGTLLMLNGFFLIAEVPFLS